MEVRARELEGRLLLALTAAERGHHVLLGDLSTLLSHRRWLPPGVYHDKSVTPSARKIALHHSLVDAGFRVTSQDEEHGLLERDYAAFAARRFSADSVGQADAVMMWGPHDSATLTGMLPGLADRIRTTGSPRTDLWRPELAALYSELPLPGIDRSRPFLLFVSNTVSMKKNPLWLDIINKRPNYFKGEDDPTEWARYRKYAEHTLYAGHAVRTIRLIARRHPDLQIVIRPHPDEGEGVWGDLVGPMPNVTVTSSGGIGRWVRAARLVVHNGCTTGFEAAISGTPVVSLQPDGWQSDVPSNLVGRVAVDVDELSEMIDASGDAQRRAAWFEGTSVEVLAGRFAALDGPLAADRIVDVWEGLDRRSGGDRPFSVGRSRLAGRLHRAIGDVRTRLRSTPSGPRGQGFRTAHKFPPLADGDLRPLVEGLRRATGRFGDVRISRHGGRLVEVRPPG